MVNIKYFLYFEKKLEFYFSLIEGDGALTK